VAVVPKSAEPTIGTVVEEDNYLEERFANLREICEHAVASNCGLIWAPG